MLKNLGDKIIELESKFSTLIKKYNSLKSTNNKLREELADKEIDVVIKNFQLKNNKSEANFISISNGDLENEIDATINDLNKIINSLKN